MARFGSWLTGTLHVELRGNGISYVLRKLQQAGVRLYDVRVNRNTCTLVVHLSDFNSLYRACRAEGVKLRFIERSGAPFVIRGLRRRQALVVGFGLFIAILFTSSSMIWQVNVTGVPGEDVPAVLQAARHSGVYRGAWKGSLSNLDATSQDMLANLPDAMWVGLSVSGAKANIQVVEKIPGVSEESTAPHNIVVAKPAVVLRVIATRGQGLLKPGQAVQPGQLAISGDLGGGAKLVAAEGKVLAEVWYQSKVELPLRVQQAGLTGASVHRSYLAIGSLSLRVWGFAEPGYTDVVERDRVTSWHLGNWELPVHWRSVNLEQAQKHAFTQSTDEAEQTALQMAAGDVRKEMKAGGVILGQSVLHRQVAHGKLYETIMTRTEEDIGVAAPIAPPSDEHSEAGN